MAEGTDLSVYAGDELLGAVQDDEAQEGRVNAGAIADVTADVEIRRYRLWEPESSRSTVTDSCTRLVAVLRRGSSIRLSQRSGGCHCARRAWRQGRASATARTGPAAFISCSTHTATSATDTPSAPRSCSARRQVTVMREMAEAGDRAAIAVLPIAGYIEQSASDAEALPDDFWVR